MKLSTALNKIKNLKSKIAQVHTYINESAVHYEDAEPPYIYEDEVARRIALIQDLRDLKVRIQLTNAKTMVTFDGHDLSLTELIMINADTRSEMAFAKEQMAHSLEGSRFETRTAESVKKMYAIEHHKEKCREWLEKLEIQKEKIDEAIADINAKTDLI